MNRATMTAAALCVGVGLASGPASATLIRADVAPVADPFGLVLPADLTGTGAPAATPRGTGVGGGAFGGRPLPSYTQPGFRIDPGSSMMGQVDNFGVGTTTGGTVSIPAPAVLLLALAGLPAMLFLRRRRRD